MHVLLVEPDKVLARTYRMALESATRTVDVSADAQSAVYCMDKKIPDVILLEMQLPRHNGIEFLYELRSYQEWQDIPVVLHTFVPLGHIDVSAEMIKTLGIVNHLYKPTTSLKQLRIATDEVLQAVAA